MTARFDTYFAGIFILALILNCTTAYSQQEGMPPDVIRQLTSEWKCERFPDGRPKVSDTILERLKNISIEEAWGVLQTKGYKNQYEGDWQIMWPDSTMTGQVVTAQFMPLRPDFDKPIKVMHQARTLVSFMASVHCPAATRNFLSLEHHSVNIPWWESMFNLVGGGKMIDKGYAPVPLTAPGLGIEINEEVVKEHLHKSDSSYFAPTDEWNEKRSHNRLYS